jgi:hypothetical protein
LASLRGGGSLLVMDRREQMRRWLELREERKRSANPIWSG